MAIRSTTPSVTETVRQHMEDSRKLREQIRGNPQKARDFLIRAGIAQPSDTDPSGIELVPDLRSGE